MELKLGKIEKNRSEVFSSEEKIKIVLELLRENMPLSAFSSKYTKYSAKTIQNWKKQFVSNAALAFKPARVLSEYQAEVNKLKEQNDELAKALGKTTVERNWALGKLKILDLSNRKSLVDSKLTLLSKARQCELLTINHSTIYYKAKLLSQYNLSICK